MLLLYEVQSDCFQHFGDYKISYQTAHVDILSKVEIMLHALPLSFAGMP
jgi:hypothetical protein